MNKETLLVLKNLAYFLLFIILVVTVTSCQKEVAPEEQARQEAMIEQLGQLDQFDLVLSKDGFVYTVASPIDKSHKNWRLTLKREHQAPTEYITWPLSMWAKQVVKVYDYDDPQWKKAALSYIKGCRMSE
jgi:hypothetical protein